MPDSVRTLSKTFIISPAAKTLYFFLLQKGVYPDLLATSGDYLRLWRVNENDTRLECLLNNVGDGRVSQCFPEKNILSFILLQFLINDYSFLLLILFVSKLFPK